ncbi:MAG TPA: choice-of-anchor D domain-containing protein [Thermoanaerobaculia bacterium]|jgi:hypothetical protein|nr:choice-of-anchor D domain-containing protein [Thermoanaerobaculia bacterium]
MACLNITEGLFYNALPDSPVWSTSGGTTTPAGVTIAATTSGILVHKGASSQPFSKPLNGAVYWVTFGNPRNFILILTTDIIMPDLPETRTVVLVETTSTGITTHPPISISATSTDSLPLVQPSEGNGSVFALLMSGNNGSVSGTVYRSDNFQEFCSTGLFTPSQQVIGNATTTQLQILEGGVTRASALRPLGSCQATPNPVTFPDAVLGASDPALATQTRQATIRNNGTDCLTISGVGNVAPYSVTGFSPPLPAVLGVGETLTAEILFAPAAVGTFNHDLPITRNPELGDDKLHCRGVARNATHSISFSGTIAFGTVPLGMPATRTLTITNNGETTVNLVIPAPAPGSDFQWAAFSGPVSPGGPAVNVAITFTPTSETPQSVALTFTSNAAGSPHHVTIAGTGCVARARIAIDAPVGAVSFGNVQRGFRSVRTVRVRNTGNGPLNFRASITGSALFGLARDSDPVTSPSSTLSFSLDPPMACGADATGPGEVVFGVTFFANDVASAIAVTGGLVIDNHNDTSAAPSFTFDLTATIVAAINTDTMLVIDRSGSMSEASGDRRKIDTAIDAGHLYVQLGRPDVGDRIGLTKFNQNPETFNSIDEITGANQPVIAATINLTELNPDGSTAIAGGVLDALRDLNSHPRSSPPPELNRTLVVLTDAIDNTPYTNPADGVTYSLLGDAGTTALPMPGNVKVYGIGIGDSIDAARLGQLAQATGGHYLHVRNFSGPDYFQLEKHFTQIYMDTADLATIVDPTYVIDPGETQSIEFDVLRGDVSCMVVVYDRDGIRLPFYLQTPHVEVIDLTTIPPGFELRPGLTSTARFLEVRFPPNDPDRYAGKWKAVIRHDGRACYANGGGRITEAGLPTAQRSFQFGFQPTACKEYSKPISYGIAVGAGSNFRMQAYVDPAVVGVGEPIRLNALLSEFGLPVIGSSVMVTSRAPDGTTETFTLYDDGAHDDDASDDGNYGNRFTHTFAEGTYEFTFRAEGHSREGEPVKREAVRSKYVEGRTPLVPPEGGGENGFQCCRWVILTLGIIGFILLLILLVLLFRR